MAKDAKDNKMNLDGFVVFDKRLSDKRRVDCPRIAISKSQITFNIGSYRRYGLDKFKSVVIYFDKEKQTVGFQFLEHLHYKNCYKLASNNNRWSIISPISFLREFKIKPQRRIELLRDDTKKNFYIAKLEK